jgi:hypothetical protein
MKDLTYYNTEKITVLRQFNKNNWLVCQGKNWYGKGLNQAYKEFSDYSDALDYFNQIK